MFAEFHFIRPLWLLLLPVLPLILLGLWRLQSHTVSWQSLIAEELRSYLIDGTSGRLSRRLYAGLGFAWLAAVLALAGPAWERLPQPVYQSGDAMVILVDLSPSMQVKDVTPSRLERMRYKLTDLIKARKEGSTALVAYAGDAHVLAPLSDDQQTLLALIPNLSPDIMPIAGSHTEEAVALALNLLKQDQRRRGSLVLLTDGVTEQASQAIEELFAQQPAGMDFRLSILGIGTSEGAPIPGRDGYVKDSAGNIVVARLEAERLAALARQTGGIYQSLQLDNRDINALIAAAGLNVLTDQAELADTTEKLEQSFDQWQEMGSWLLLLVLPVAALAFRRGWLLLILLVPVLPGQELRAEEAAVKSGFADSFENLWLTEDQQAARALQQGDTARAAELFTQPDWQATARYRNGDFAEAAEQFARQGDATGLYNSGNALARSGKLQEALAAYEQVLEQQPEHEDALANKQLIEDLLRQQNQQGQNSQNSQGEDDQSPENQSSDNSGSQSQDSEGKQEQGSDNQSSGSDQQSGSNDQQGGESTDSDAGNQDQQQAGGADQSDSEQQSKMQQLQQQLDQQQSDALAEQQAQQAKQEPQPEAADTQAAGQSGSEQQSPEEAALQKWLGQLPEDAGGLLRNKFNYEYQKKRRAYQNGEWQPAQEQRW